MDIDRMVSLKSLWIVRSPAPPSDYRRGDTLTHLHPLELFSLPSTTPTSLDKVLIDSAAAAGSSLLRYAGGTWPVDGVPPC